MAIYFRTIDAYSMICIELKENISRYAYQGANGIHKQSPQEFLSVSNMSFKHTLSARIRIQSASNPKKPACKIPFDLTKLDMPHIIAAATLLFL
jgi:hypothetical protein